MVLKNGGRGTKPTDIFMVIIPLLVIELKATPNGNPSDDFFWRQKFFRGRRFFGGRNFLEAEDFFWRQKFMIFFGYRDNTPL